MVLSESVFSLYCKQHKHTSQLERQDSSARIAATMIPCAGQNRQEEHQTSRQCKRRRMQWSRPANVVTTSLSLSIITLLSFILISRMLKSAEAQLQFDQVPNSITNQQRATFTYVCTPLDESETGCEDIQYSLDYGDWRPASTSNSTVMLYGLSDDSHSLQLKNVFNYEDAEGSGQDSAESATLVFRWTVDTIAPNTIIDSGPSQEGEAPRPEEADPFLFFTFHCSEDSCLYRYQFDSLIELTATWDAVDGNGLEGHVTVTQVAVSKDGKEGKAKFQISVFLTVSSSYGNPEDPQSMPATVSIFKRDGYFAEGEGSAFNSSEGSTTVNGEEDVGEAGGEPLVELTLGAPEVDSGTGNTVFSLSAEEQVPGHLELNSSLYVAVFANSSALLFSAALEESITSKEWLRWPYASELPGSHMVAIAAVDEAGNVDPTPAHWTWSVDARPRTSLDSAPQAETASDTAFFAFSCALPGSDAEATAAEQDTFRNSIHSVNSNSNSNINDDHISSTNATEGSEGEGVECTYFYSLDGGNYTAVKEQLILVSELSSRAASEKEEEGSSTAAGGGLSSTSGGEDGDGEREVPGGGTSTSLLLLEGLADGEHELSVFACKTNSTECDPQPLTHSWKTNTSAPVTSIVSFPDSLTPSEFNFSSSKPLSRFMCRLDGGRWRDCEEHSLFPLPDGPHNLSVLAVDPTGRSDATPVHHIWEVNMLDTIVEYCPPTRVPSDDADLHRVLLVASFDGVRCSSAMDCRVRYALDWLAPSPVSSGGACVAPPTAAPSPMPSPYQPPTSSTDDGTPSPTWAFDGGEVADGGQNYLLRSVVRCAEAWANCSTLEAETTYGDGGEPEGGCTKLETVVGEMGYSQGTLILENLLPGDYNLTLEASNGFGGVDHSPVLCPFRVLAEGEAFNQTQILLVRRPPKEIDSPDQAPAIFEFAVVGGAAGASDTSSQAESRLSYFLSGPGAKHEWRAVPVVPRDEWAARLANSSEEGKGEESGGDFVWGLALENLDDGEYRLQARDNLLGDTKEYTWKVNMAMPQLTLDASPQDPSHSAESVFFLRCSKLSCGLEYELEGNGAWYQWDPTTVEARHTPRSGAPTPAPEVGRQQPLSGSSGDGGGGKGSDEDEAFTVSVISQQVSDHELAFRVNVTVPDSGNYTLAIRPTEAEVAAAAAAASSSSRGTSSSSARESGSSDGLDDYTVTVKWNVDLTRPETKVLYGPDPVTTEGSAEFLFACELDGERLEYPQECLYEYQISTVGMESALEMQAEVDWESKDWFSTADSVTLYEIGEGVNMIRVRAQDASTELYDLAPAEVTWIRDATPPKMEWEWTPEETSHRAEALFEFTCSGEVSLDLQSGVIEESGQRLSGQQQGFAGATSSHSASSSSDTPYAGSNIKSKGDSSSGDSSGAYSSSSSVGRDRDDSWASVSLAAMYPSAFPRVMPSGCAFEARLDDADFEPVPNAVTLTGLSNGDHRFSVNASDLAGNVARTKHFDWTVNTNVPDTIIIAAPAPRASSTSASFRIMDTVKAAQGKGHFEYRLDNTAENASWLTTWNTTLTFHGLEDGTHTLTVRARESEEAGGSSDQVPEVVTWVVDTTCPDTNFVVLPDVVTHLTSDVLVVKGNPDAASFEYALYRLGVEEGEGGAGDGYDEGDNGYGSDQEGEGRTSASAVSGGASSSAGAGTEGEDSRVWQAGDSSGVIHLHHLQEGRHEVQVRAVDSAGNFDPSPATYSWIVDRAGVYGQPSMVTDVIADGGNKKADVSWAPVADDGGGALTKYIVVAATAYADISVEAIATVYPVSAGEEPPTEATVTGLTNGLIYSFQVVAVNAFGHSTRSLPSNKVMTYDPDDPCGMVTCGDHGSCFIERSRSNALRGYCVCRPGYSGSDCSVAETASDDSALMYGAYPGSWGECDTKCGGGFRYRSVQCVPYVDGIPMASLGNGTSCWEDSSTGDSLTSETDLAEGSCRHVACLAMFLDVIMRLRAFYDDACFTVAAQEAFLSGFAAEVAHALNIKWGLLIDLNVLRTDKHNEIEVRFIIAPGRSGADQPIENLREQLLVQAASKTSRLRTHGTWTRKLIPDSLEVSQGTYELPSLSVRGIASDLVIILMAVGTTCLAVAVYGACSSRKSKKWDSVYDGEYEYGGAQSPRQSDRDNAHEGISASGDGGGSAASRRSGWFQLDDDSEDSDSDWEEEDESSPFFGRCALRLLCRPEETQDGDDASGLGSGSGRCNCTRECGGEGGATVGGNECNVSVHCPCGGFGAGVTSGENSDGIELRTRTPGATAEPSGLESVVPIPLPGKNRPPPALLGDVRLHRRRVGVLSGQGSSSLATTRDVEDGSRPAPRGGRSGGGNASDAGLEVQRPGRQAMI